ncbi:class I SAM-dependent methyltransferase [Cuspidothrix issatschenkoi]|uniref:Methyltransferase type 11 domain-containing protein n=1 Tax=Cuspidothrix issatschenkoi CHARLIE-1 TaxID=2052836 RepID=A0A2S6CTU9_9CYAN|nr:class I SAM-dependent methyltransferase [Cuspidothrix issatschenkoi]PPJ63020.1 hypothetical protein CUN59_12380 [Cuspidothrix issatschenkoi CHARLIE-1]
MESSHQIETKQIINELMEIQAEYPNCDLSQFQSLISANQYNQLYLILSKYIVKGSKVLDWGCGNGHFSYFLLTAGYQTDGFSFNDFSLRQYLKLNYNFKLGNRQEPKILPYANNQFDAVVSVGVLEHVRETGGNEIDSLKEIYRILKPGGYFICYHFPNQFSWIETISAYIPNKHHHEYRYNKRMINNLCQQSGLEILELKRYGFLPRNISSKLPKRLKKSALISNIWNISDEILQYLFSWFCQNYLFVTQKPDISIN